jgi:hypothetical protein
MDVHPVLDTADQVVRVFGWPFLLGVIIWAVRTWDRGSREIKETGENAKVAVAQIANVKTQVDLITSNHLAHLQEGIGKLTESNDKAVEILHDIKGGIDLLVDRTPRL